MHNSSGEFETGREKRVRKQNKTYDDDYVLYDENDRIIKTEPSDINELATNQASGSTSSATPNEIKYVIGDLVWAKVSGHPWWPCVISKDPNENNTFIKAVGLVRPKRMFYVEFYGPSVEHAWVAENGLIEYKGIEAFKEYAQNQVDQAPTKSQKEKLAERFQLKVALTRREQWEKAVEEADESLKHKLNDSSNLPYKRKKEISPKTKPNETKSAAKSENIKRDDSALKATNKQIKLEKYEPNLAQERTKREIRKPKYFAEQQQLPIASVNSNSNLNLLSQIATNEVTQQQQQQQQQQQHESSKLTRRQTLLEKKQSAQNVTQATNNRRNNNRLSLPVVSNSNNKKDPFDETSSEASETLKIATKNNRRSKKEVNEDRENQENEEREEENDENEEDLLDEIDIEYDKLLNNGGASFKKENVCGKCEMPFDLIDCTGTCLQSFHLDCVGLMKEPKEAFKCDECASGNHTCFQCKKSSIDENITRKCSHAQCGKYYHDECVKQNHLFRQDPNKKGEFTCPQHACATCMLEAYPVLPSSSTQDSTSAYYKSKNQSALMQAQKGRFFRCVRCPVAYHSGDHCLAAGCIGLAGNSIICPNHFSPARNNHVHNVVNVTWCFVCCQSADLLGCASCPAAYHFDCLDNPPDVACNNWQCEDCQLDKRPLYGDIVWVKVGVYRWWPAQICHPRNLPKNIRDIPHQVGEFCVRFFGSNDYFWINRGRCFTFAEDDEYTRSSSKNLRGLIASFQRGVQHAKIAFKHIQKRKMEKLGKESQRLAKSDFVFIKINKPVGDAQVRKVPLADLPCCECDPNKQNPCATDDCINRALKYECHPGVCRAGTRCQNQRFTKRQYPRQEAVKTGDRGWGLRSLIEIKKGEFVNEYVGELISEDECRRRLELSYENDVTNFYFLTLDKDRVIDAGPKGNLSRFMNHSCEPNLETQKWNVNGDIRVGLFAKQDIPANTELTFNYNMDCLNNERAVCKCGAKSCSGFIGSQKNSNNNNNGDKTKRNAKKRKLNEDSSKNGRSLSGNIKKVASEDDMLKSESSQASKSPKQLSEEILKVNIKEEVNVQ